MGRWLAVFAIAGLGLLAIPWLVQREPEPLPERVAAGDDWVRRALAVAASVDQASVQGRVEDLRRLVTDRCFESLVATLAQVGRPLDAGTLREQGAWVGGLGELPFLAGGGAGDRLLLVFDARPAGLVTARWLRVGDALEFDERLEVVVPEGADARLLAEDIVRRFGAGR